MAKSGKFDSAKKLVTKILNNTDLSKEEERNKLVSIFRVACLNDIDLVSKQDQIKLAEDIMKLDIKFIDKIELFAQIQKNLKPNE